MYALYRLLVDEAKAAQMAEKFRRGGMGYGDAKKELFAVANDHFAPFRAKREKIAADRSYVGEVRRRGAEKARNMGAPTLRKVREPTGISASDG